eukprot:CAMPEP_0118934052 /NCGR_PEP_ID=MMETSP1169-20130426/13473_1 /TAXON_ID=36882 /ORGANISM="Pyramimonas obovata, Strain CCMP722" /LENGTH=525 /DNA_ID=CAMNT_0006876913 /DNA_START=111 /DNA_END=1688 /DNA_ORIENTATION=+
MDELHCDLLGMLEVVCHKAVELTGADTLVTDAKLGSDTYCKLMLVDTVPTNPKVPNRCEVNGSLHQSTVKTNVEHATLNPHWEQAFKLPVLSDTMCLKAYVYHQDVAGGDKFLGVAQIDLIDHFFLPEQQHAVKKTMYPLKADEKHANKKVTGSVELSLAFLPNTNTVVSVTVVDGKGVSTALPGTTKSTKVKMCGWIVDETGVKSAGSASPLKETHSVTHNGAPKWNTTIYMDHMPTHPTDTIRMKILEVEKQDGLAACFPALCASPNSPMKAVGKVDLPISQLVQEQKEMEMKLAEAGEYGPKYLSKSLALMPHTATASKDVKGTVSLHVRYMTPEVRAAVRAVKARKAGIKTPAAATRAVPDFSGVPDAAKVAADKAAAAATEAQSAATAASSKAAKDAADKAAKEAAAKAAKEMQAVEDAAVAAKELKRLASAAAQKPPPVVKAASGKAPVEIKARAAPAPTRSDMKPAPSNNLFKKAVRTVMFVAGSQVLKSKFEHPRTTTAKQNTLVATAAGFVAAQVV